jgi:hypothetical protein
MQAQGGFSASPTALAFGDVPLGASLGLSVEITNGSVAGRTLSLWVEPPLFSLESDRLALVGGGSSRLTVTFAPTALQAAAGTLHLDDGATSVEIALTGNGVAACQASSCHSTRFDAETRACVEAPLPDGAACVTPCLVDASCHAGQCVGRFEACDDQNPCTVDLCGADGGCEHAAQQCPVNDPCKVAYCDPTAGCATHDVEDGAPCGAATCRTAKICLGGSCRERARPTSQDDCTYLGISSGDTFSCALAVSGRVRCWGESVCQSLPCSFPTYSTGRAYPSLATSPDFIPGVSQGRQVAAGDLTTCVLSGAGSVSCFGANPPPAVLTLPVARLEPIRLWHDAQELEDDGCFLSTTGSVECWEAIPTFGRAPFSLGDGGATDFARSSAEVCRLIADAGLDCLYSGRQPVDGPAPSLKTATGSIFALFPGGSVLQLGLGGARWVADAGVTEVGGTSCPSSGWCWKDRWLCLVHDGGVGDCEQGSGSPPRRVLVDVPGGITQLSGGNRHVCALNPAGEIWCWGGNEHGQLGDRSVQPATPVELAPDGVTEIAAAPGVTVTLRDGRVQVYGSGLFPDFAGHRLADGGEPVEGADLGPVSDLKSIEAVFTLEGRFAACMLGRTGEVKCWSEGRPLGSVMGVGGVRSLSQTSSGQYFDILNNDGLAAIDTNDRLWALSFSDLTAYPMGVTVRQAEGGCLAFDDGGVTCGVQNRISLPSPAVVLSASGLGGCAVLSSGATSCWGPIGTSAPISGVWPFARLVVGSLREGCAVSGFNGVQCWGENYDGELGREGPTAAGAVSLPMGDPVAAMVASDETHLGEFNVGPHRCALLQSGRAVCWGNNVLGQLGVAPLLWSDTPQRVSE